MKYFNKIYLIISIILALSVLILAPSCLEQKPTGFMGNFPYLEIVSSTDTSISKEAQDVSIKINTNRPVEIQSGEYWVQWVKTSETEIIFHVNENDTEEKRTAKIECCNKILDSRFTITITQAESGVKTFRGDFIIDNQKKMDELLNNYTRIDGNLIIGTVTNSQQTQTTDISIVIDGKEYNFSDSYGIPNLRQLSALTEITQGMYIVKNNSLNDLTGIGKFDLNILQIIANPKITDISPVSTMDVDSLTIKYSGNIGDFNPLENMQNLLSLDISRNELYNHDIAFLSKLNSLQYLTLGSATGETNKIYDIAPVMDLDLKRLNISGLYVSESQIADYQREHPFCEIIKQNMLSGIVTLSTPAVSRVTVSSMTLSCKITDQGYGEISEKGFYFGKDTHNLEKVQCESAGDGTFTYTANSLDSVTAYHAYAYAINEIGKSSSAITVQYTDGKPVIDDTDKIDCRDHKISVYTDIIYNGEYEPSAQWECGALLGTSETLDYDNGRKELSDNDGRISCVFDNLHSGHKYYVRSYAKNRYGITYGNVTKQFTTGSSDLPVHNITADITLPEYLNYTETQTGATGFFGMWKREDIRKQYGWVSGEGANPYVFGFHEGLQDLIFTNIPEQGMENVRTETGVNNLPLKFSMTGDQGLGTEIFVAAMKDHDLTEDENISLIPDRISSRISISLSYTDSMGMKADDLSDVIKSISVTMSGLSKSYEIDDRLVGHYKDMASLKFETVDITYTSVQSVCENIHILPTENEIVKFETTITFLDGKTITLNNSHNKIAGNKNYNYVLNLYHSDNNLNASFKIDVIENVDEEIEF